MKPDPRFEKQPKTFWANVRTISAQSGYTVRGSNQIKVPTFSEMTEALIGLGLEAHHVVMTGQKPTPLGKLLEQYFRHRARVLNEHVEANLMHFTEAQKEFERLHANWASCHLPLNKQKGPKRAPAYFTGIINMLIEANLANFGCDYNPRALTTVTRNNLPVRTLARWVDGAFPASVNPIAIWEIKEYYYTTTFGSRVADGIYESLLDGMELEELREHENIDVKHYLMVDAYDTWWKKGKSYLCRIVDMLHMGYLDEVLFGREVLERLPRLVKEWVAEARKRGLP